MMIHPEVAQHISEIRKLCREFGVSRLEIFGSAVTDAFDPARSDVDFLVAYPDDYDFGDFGERLFRFEDRLSSIIGRKADVVMTSVLTKPRFLQEISQTRTTIYDAADTRIVA